MGKKTYSYDKVLCKKFGQKVAYLRKEKSLKQDETAFMIGISTSYLSSIERGLCDATLTTAKRIAKVLDIEIHELLFFDNIKK